MGEQKRKWIYFSNLVRLERERFERESAENEKKRELFVKRSIAAKRGAVTRAARKFNDDVYSF